jgi:hypothetical protein
MKPLTDKLRRVDGTTQETALVPAEAGPPAAPFVTRLMFAPLRIASKRVAPRLSARAFESLWRMIDDDEPPRPQDPQRSVAKLALALGLEGACTALVRGLMDHASRREFARLTGRWPSRRPKA